MPASVNAPDCPERFRPLAGRLIVSCQAWEDDAFHAPGEMARFARAAIEGGAAALRINGPDDVREIRATTSVPIIALQKRNMADGRILITPTFEDARALAEAGADAVALDCTARGQSHGALERLRRVKGELGVAVTADIATVEEAVAAAAAGADFILSTLRGYTDQTAHARHFDARFIAELVRNVRAPVIAEGHLWTPEEALAALEAGAFAVVVGSAITRPRDITARFVRALARAEERRRATVVALDVGGTNIKGGIVSAAGEVTRHLTQPTCTWQGRAGLLAQMAEMARELATGAGAVALGVGTAGWVDTNGMVAYSTPNLPEWTGTEIAASLAPALGLPVYVENDANALAIGEKRFGSARDAATFVCITLGTGVGGGCYIEGRLRRGARGMGNAIGHLTVEPDGAACNCGRLGCLEQYANAAALLRYAGGGYASAAAAIDAANRGDERARAAIRTLASYLARGCELAIALLDPELIVISGGLAERNPLLFEELTARVGKAVAVRPSALGYYAGVAGAGAAAFDRLCA